MTTPGKVIDPHTPPYKRVAVVMLVVSAVITALVYGQFRGDFTPEDALDHAVFAGGFGDGSRLEGHL